MAAPAGLTDGSVPEPAEPDPPDPAGDGEATGDANALAVADPEPDPALADPEPDPAVADPALADPALADPAVADPAVADPGAEPARRTSPLAVAAVIVGLIVLAGVAVGVLAVATHGFRPKTVIQYRLAAVFSLRPGECLNSSPNGLGVTVLSCAAPHDAEVFATFSLTAASWPGTAAVQSQASNGCLTRFAGYVSPQFADAGLAQEYYYPDKSAWQAGVRTVVCEVSATTGQLTGSVRASG
ncbi:MAG TPA: septum formation family protein [Streptosporangiaceae bacterium]|nr:septum formation family protein [Streptosporangiaceae bacterium]